MIFKPEPEPEPELEQRYDELVGQLRLLSEADSLSIVSFGSHRGKLEGSAPKGAQPEKRTDEWGGPYDPDYDPLLLWFLWRWARAEDDERKQRAVLAEGELRLARRYKHQPGRVAGAVNAGSMHHESEEDRDLRIAEAYIGLAPVEVKVIETELRGFCPEANVRKVRIQHKRDPETGQPREDSNDERSYAVELRKHGHSLGSIAMRIGKPKTTVSRWVKGVKVAA